MTRKILLSLLTLLIVFCIGLSVMATAGAVVIYQYSRQIPVQVMPTPQSGVSQPRL